MACVRCGKDFFLPRSELVFSCSCGARHTLSDYLGIGAEAPDDWAREEAAISLRNVMEHLTLFHFLIQYRNRPEILRRTLFVKDGPLLLRAQLSRLVEPIRAYFVHLKQTVGPVFVVGIEKNGELVNHVGEIADVSLRF